MATKKEQLDELTISQRTRMAKMTPSEKESDFRKMTPTLALLTAKKHTDNKKTQEAHLDEVSPAQAAKIAKLKEIGQKMKDVNNIFITGQRMKDDMLVTAARAKLAQLAKIKHDIETQVVDEDGGGSAGIYTAVFSSPQTPYTWTKFWARDEDDAKERVKEIFKRHGFTDYTLTSLKRDAVEEAKLDPAVQKRLSDRKAEAKQLNKLIKKYPDTEGIYRGIAKLKGLQLDEGRQQDVVNELIAELGDKYDEGKIENMVSYLIAGGHTMPKGNPYYELCKAACDKMGFVCSESMEENIEIDGIKAKPVAGPGATAVGEDTDNKIVHRVSVTVIDHNHPMVSKRKEKDQKIIRVKNASSPEDAVARAKRFYKRNGYKVIDAEYLGTTEGDELDEGWKSKLAGAALAGSMALGGAGAAHAASDQPASGVKAPTTSRFSVSGYNSPEYDQKNYPIYQKMLQDYMAAHPGMDSSFARDIVNGRWKAQYHTQVPQKSFTDKPALDEVKSGTIKNHVWLGKEVKTPDGVGTVEEVERKPTFSQMVPWVTIVWVRLPGEKYAKDYRKDMVRVVKDKAPVTEANEGVDTIEMDVELFIRCLEWAKESAPDDIALHKFTENVVAKNGILTMDDYESLVPQGAPVEEGVGDVVKGIKRAVKGKESPEDVQRKYFDKSMDALYGGDKKQQEKASKNYLRVAKVTSPKITKDVMGEETAPAESSKELSPKARRAVRNAGLEKYLGRNDIEGIHVYTVKRKTQFTTMLKSYGHTMTKYHKKIIAELEKQFPGKKILWHATVTGHDMPTIYVIHPFNAVEEGRLGHTWGKAETEKQASVRRRKEDQKEQDRIAAKRDREEGETYNYGNATVTKPGTKVKEVAARKVLSPAKQQEINPTSYYVVSDNSGRIQAGPYDLATVKKALRRGEGCHAESGASLIKKGTLREDASAGATGSASVATVVSGTPGIIKRTGSYKKKGRYGNSVTPKTFSALSKGIYEAEEKKAEKFDLQAWKKSGAKAKKPRGQWSEKALLMKGKNKVDEDNVNWNAYAKALATKNKAEQAAAKVARNAILKQPMTPAPPRVAKVKVKKEPKPRIPRFKSASARTPLEIKAKNAMFKVWQDIAADIMDIPGAEEEYENPYYVAEVCTDASRLQTNAGLTTEEEREVLDLGHKTLARLASDFGI